MIDWILKMISEFGLMAIVIIVFLEYACFPVPSEIILPMAGAMAPLYHLNFFLILLLCTVAGMLGSFFCYLIGYFGGNKIIAVLIKKNPKLKKSFDQSVSIYHRFSDFSVALARIVPLCRTYIAFIAGSFRQNTGRYLLYSLIGILIWNGVLIGLGYFFADNIDKIALFIADYKMIVGFLAVIVGMYLLYRKRMFRKIT